VKVVKIVNSSGFGSLGTGIFIDDDLVVTAAHVIQPVPGAIDPQKLKVIVPGGSVSVKSTVCLERWSHNFQSDGDIAVLRTTQPCAALKQSYTLDPQPANLAVTIVGYPNAQFSGAVDLIVDDDGFHMLSSDIAFPGGVSGGPIVDDSTEAAIGIAIRSAPQVGDVFPIGIPFLTQTLVWLINNCP
jgi:hypothetical protein